MGAWLVSLETMHTDDATRVDLSSALAPVGGEIFGEESGGRCTVRLLVPGGTANDALSVAMDVWRSAVDGAGRPGWPVFAADVVERVDAPRKAPTKKKPARKTA
ncbi:MAG TPA: hypothetical protein VNA12_09915 [Mycobacteriales bacterium]|nr:hypothetical protein [Mycobacteriales bacterium]